MIKQSSHRVQEEWSQHRHNLLIKCFFVSCFFFVWRYGSGSCEILGPVLSNVDWKLQSLVLCLSDSETLFKIASSSVIGN